MKMAVKKAAMHAYSVAIAPMILASKADRYLPGDGGFIFEVCANALALIPGIIGRDVRHAFYHHVLKRCGDNLRVGYGSFFEHIDAEVGDNVTIGCYCTVGWVSLGNDVMLANHISILDGLHHHGYSDLNASMQEQAGHHEDVHIGDHTWIGEGAIVAANVGEKSIIGVGSVVTREMQPGVICMGNPARVVNRRDKPLVRPGPKTAKKPASDAKKSA